MTQTLDQRRRGQVAWIAALAMLAVIGATLVYGLDTRRRAPPQSPGLAAPGLSARPNAAEVILVVTKDATYRLAKESRGWTMKDRGGYPVRQEAVAAFTEALAKLRYARPMTRDPEKLARLGLDDPRQGGAGALLQVQDSQGALLADVIIGGGEETLYLRPANANQTWTADGALPPIRDASAWLDLRPLELPTARIARLDVARNEGVYAIFKSLESGDFVLARPFSERPALEPGRVGRVAAALGALKPIDVAPAPSITGAPEARLTLQTVDGLALDAEVFSREARSWVRLAARATTPERAAEASAINRRAGPWAFALPAEVAADLAPPIGDLVRLPPPKSAPGLAVSAAGASAPPTTASETPAESVPAQP